MKLLIDDGNQIRLGTGIGKYSYYLYRALLNIGCDVELVNQFEENSSSRIKQRLYYIQKINSLDYQKYIADNYDVVIYTNYVVPCKKNPRTKYLGVIPDMVSYVFPKTLPLFYRLYNQMMIRNTVKNADLIFTISESVKNEILEKFPSAEGRLAYTWLGLYDGIQPLKEYPPYENEELNDIDMYPFFLFVSTVEKRKNVGLVIEAFIRLKDIDNNAKKYKLVIVGRPGFGYEGYVKKAYASKYRNDIIFTGFVSNQDCNRLYNHAKAFIFPTIYEGFGFAQIECMKCHLPIILSNISTNREITRDYGLYFELSAPETLVDALKLITNDLIDNNELARVADNYLLDFDWSKIALQYMQIIEKSGI